MQEFGAVVGNGSFEEVNERMNHVSQETLEVLGLLQVVPCLSEANKTVHVEDVEGSQKELV